MNTNISTPNACYFIQSNLHSLSTILIGMNPDGILIESNSEYIQTFIHKGMTLMAFIEYATLGYEFARVESFLRDQYNNHDVFWTEMKAALNSTDTFEDYLIIGTPLIKNSRFEGYILECVKQNPAHIKLSNYQTLNPVSELFDRSFGERIGQTLFNKNFQGNKPFTLVGFEIMGYSNFVELYDSETLHHLIHFAGQSLKRCLRQNDTPYDAEAGRFYVLCEASKDDLRPMIDRVQSFLKSNYIKEIEGVIFFKSAYAEISEVTTFQQLLHLLELRLKT